MGRKKLRIKRLEDEKERQIKYSKRKSGVIKKAKELAILCDVAVAVLTFSPTGRPSICVENEDLSEMLERLSNLTFEDREERRAYTMKLLEKMFLSNPNFDFEPSKFSTEREDELKVHEDKLIEIKEALAEKSNILRDWKNPSNVQDLAQLNIMEDHLAAHLDSIKQKKSELAMLEQMDNH